nr:hypothetical protein [Tanacetum cinerariifolium]
MGGADSVLAKLKEHCPSRCQCSEQDSKHDLQQPCIILIGCHSTSVCERKPKKGQNRIKTGQKREAWRNQEKSEAVTVDREEKLKKMQKEGPNLQTLTKYIKERRRDGLEVQFAKS